MDKTTLDDVLKRYQELGDKAASQSSGHDQTDWLNEGKREAYWNAGKFLHDNRDAIIAGMQKPLRFKIDLDSGDRETPPSISVHLVGWVQPDRLAANALFKEESTEKLKQHCKEFAASLGLPCEFVED